MTKHIRTIEVDQLHTIIRHPENVKAERYQSGDILLTFFDKGERNVQKFHIAADVAALLASSITNAQRGDFIYVGKRTN